jgi:sulfatase maturation enzyme AslB (radical SAM superfamily)
MKRVGLIITQKCTLKCRLCGEYCPYIKNPQDMPVEILSKIIDNYFGTADSVEDFCVSGGEPLFHKEFDKVLSEILRYKHRINRIMILTNATIPLNEKTQNIIKQNPEKFFLNISNYGKLSGKSDELAKQAEALGISYRSLNYAEGELYHNGWVDYIGHEKKHFTEEEIAAQSKSCAFIGKGYGLCIQNGKMFICARSWRRMYLGIIPDNPREYVDFTEDIKNFEEKKKELSEFLNLKTQTSCAYCAGMRDDAVRYKPAEQLTKAELEDIVSGKKFI